MGVRMISFCSLRAYEYILRGIGRRGGGGVGGQTTLLYGGKVNNFLYKVLGKRSMYKFPFKTTPFLPTLLIMRIQKVIALAPFAPTLQCNNAALCL